MAGKRTGKAPQPTGEARVTMYDVGFGDCFLLTVPYDDGTARQVLIDCGAHGSKKVQMQAVAEAVAGDCGGKLDAIVATHRHKDHISAFGMKGPAAVFAGLEPELVVQPWTEDPKADEQALGPVEDGARHLSVGEHLLGLEAAQGFAEELVAKLEGEGHRLCGLSADTQADLASVASLSIRNKAAVTWLVETPKDREYVYAGCDAAKLRALLPGVGVTVLGPPTLKQSQAIRHGATSGGAEFWKLQKGLMHGMAEGAGGAVTLGALFPGAPTVDPAQATPQDRWMLERLNRVQSDNVQRIVRSLDDALNNTSIILLLQIGKHRLLFAGDAQVENWAYALSQPELAQELAGTTLYKVGHHASGNATPKSLWKLLTDERKVEGRLVSMLSTMVGPYDGVPQKHLMKALETQSDLHSSIEMRKAGKLSETWVLEA